jgi:hypothetical protein
MFAFPPLSAYSPFPYPCFGHRKMTQQGADQLPDMSAATDAQARRVLALKRAFQRELRHRPTTLQRTLIDRAAIMTARAEIAASDPNTSPNDVVRLDGAASRARAAMFGAIAKREPARSLDAYLAAHPDEVSA